MGNIMFRRAFGSGQFDPPGDATAPTVVITALSAVANVVAMRITFSEVVTGFVVGDITISGGSLASFATADNITFTVSWTLAAGANTMDIAAGVCKDAAGNDNAAATQYALTYLLLQPSTATAQDVKIKSDAATTNYDTGGDAETLCAGEANNASNRILRTLIKFDLSTIPENAEILSSILSLYATIDLSSNARTFRVYPLKRAWVANQATWNIYSTGNNWQTAGGFGANDCTQTAIGSRDFTDAETLNEMKNFTLTPTTKEGLDLGNGWLVKADTETDDQYFFAGSADATSSKRPKFACVYHVPT